MRKVIMSTRIVAAPVAASLLLSASLAGAAGKYS